MARNDSPFEVHILNSRGIAKAKRLQHLFEITLDLVREITGQGDALLGGNMEMNAFEAHLIEASFHAKRALAIRYENQQNENEAKVPADAATGSSTQAADVDPVAEAVIEAIRGRRNFSAAEANRLIEAIRYKTR